MSKEVACKMRLLPWRLIPDVLSLVLAVGEELRFPSIVIILRVLLLAKLVMRLRHCVEVACPSCSALLLFLQPNCFLDKG